MSVTEVSKGWTYNFTIVISAFYNFDFIAAGVEWKSLADNDKSKYQKMAAQDKVSQLVFCGFKF